MALTTRLVDTMRDAYVEGLVTDITYASKGLFSVSGIPVNAGTVCTACACMQVAARSSVRGRLTLSGRRPDWWWQKPFDCRRGPGRRRSGCCAPRRCVAH